MSSDPSLELHTWLSICLLNPTIGNPKVTCNSTYHQPSPWSSFSDILRKVKATSLLSHSRQGKVTRCKPSMVKVHPPSATCRSLWDRKLGEKQSFLLVDVFPLWCPFCCVPLGVLVLRSRMLLLIKNPMLIASFFLRPSCVWLQLSHVTPDWRTELGQTLTTGPVVSRDPSASHQRRELFYSRAHLCALE